MIEDVPDPLPVGYRLDRYIIECELPRAELGRVYKAFDTALNQVVAINVLAVELRNQEGRWRMWDALRRARGSPGSPAYDGGIAHGVPFVTVAYVLGVGAAIDVAKA
jgi:hypothetical protein